MKTAIRYLFAIYLLLLTSCSDTASMNTPKNSCFVIGGCDREYYNLDRVFIRLNVNIEKKFQISRLTRHNITDGNSISITLPRLYSICGKVIYSESPVYATIRFIPENSELLLPPVNAETDKSGSFCTMLPEGNYTILISPYKSDSIPQLKTTVKVNSEIPTLTILYPSPENVRYIYGNVILDSKSGIPVEGINVLAYREYDKGITLQSNVSVTDSEGRFSIIVPTKSESFSLMLYGSEKNPDWPVIKLPDIISEEIVQIGTINLGFVPPLRHISGSVSAENKNRIIATMNRNEFLYTKTFITDSEGYFETDLREGRYTFLIIPEDIHNSEWSITSSTDITVPDADIKTISIERKVDLEGVILPLQNRYTPKINIRRLGGCLPEQNDNISLESSILPDSNGKFKAPVHYGKYRIEISSDDPLSAGLISEPMCIGENTNLGQLLLSDSCELTVRLENPDNLSVSAIKAEVFISDKSETDVVKISEKSTESPLIKLKVPGYLCR